MRKNPMRARGGDREKGGGTDTLRLRLNRENRGKKPISNRIQKTVRKADMEIDGW